MEKFEDDKVFKAKAVNMVITEGSGREIIVAVTPKGAYVQNTRASLNAEELKFLITILESPLIKDIEKAIS